MGYKVTSLHGKKFARAAEILMDSSTNGREFERILGYRHSPTVLEVALSYN